MALVLGRNKSNSGIHKCEAGSLCSAISQGGVRWISFDGRENLPRTKLYISVLFNYKKKSKILLGGSYVC
jgi:hypothetical protein